MWSYYMLGPVKSWTQCTPDLNIRAIGKLYILPSSMFFFFNLLNCNLSISMECSVDWKKVIVQINTWY